MEINITRDEAMRLASLYPEADIRYQNPDNDDDDAENWSGCDMSDFNDDKGFGLNFLFQIWTN